MPDQENQHDMTELFLDRQEISWEYNVERRLQQPVRHHGNPILSPEYPWEQEYTTIYGSVLPMPEGGFGMWYMSGAKGMQAQQMLCFARSDDGFEWRRVMSKQHPYEGIDTTNILLGPEPNVHGPCVMRNEHDQNSDARYLLMYDSYWWHRPNDLGLQGSRWCYTATSPDGLDWAPTLGRPAIPGKSDIGQSVVWDPVKRRYIAYVRGTRMPDPQNPHGSAYGEKRTVRYVRASTSPDFENWSEPFEIMRADETDGDPDHQFHQLSVTRLAGGYVGLLSLFHVDGCVTDEQYKTMELGTCDTQLCFSRDGLNFSRVADRDLFFPLGQPGQWDSSWTVTASQFVCHGDRMLFYYASTDRGRDEGHRYSIGVATLPLNRFQALRPGRTSQPAIIETKPQYLGDGDLTLNADASRGQITVELCDFNGEALKGFTRDDCAAIETDGLKQVVRWKAGRLSDAVAKDQLYRRAIRIRFYLQDASLYGASWNKTDQPAMQ